MAIAVICPGCEADYSVPENLSGKTIRCKKCGEMMTVRAPRAKARVPDDDGDDPRPVGKRRAVRDARDEDERVPAKSPANGPSPLVLAAAAALLLAAGAVGAYFLFSPGDSESKAVAKNDGGVPPAEQPKEDPSAKVGSGVVSGAKEKALTAEKSQAGLKGGDPSAAKAQAGAGKQPQPVEKDEPKPVGAADTSDEPKLEPNPPEGEKELEPKKPANESARPEAPRAAADPKNTEEPKKTSGMNLGHGVATEQPGSTTGMSRAEYMSGVMSPATLERVKKASVFIKTDLEGGFATGSGWFGIEPGIVFTNAHVLNMTAPNAPPPKRLTFYLNSGTPQQRVIPNANIKILAVDRDIDLACLQVVNEPDLPAPLRVRPSEEVIEGTGLNTIGYPFGYTPAGAMSGVKKEPEVSVRRTTVTAFRRNNFGILRRVQVEGAANPGNSGGPVVDAEGTVCAVIVMGVHGGGGALGGIALTGCVPTEYCFGLLAGRVGKTEYGMPYRHNGKVRIPVRVEILDPFARLKKVGVLAWTGNVSEKYRAPGPNPPKAEPGDEHLTEVALAIDQKAKLATGEIELPEPGSGAAYWAQIFYENAIYPRYHQPGAVIPVVGPPADRVPALLVYKPKLGTSRVVNLTGSSDLSEEAEGEGQSKDERVLIRTALKAKETTQQPVANDPVQAARLVYQFDEIEMPKAVIGTGGQEQDLFPKEILRIINTFVRQTSAVALANKLGQIYKHNINALNIPDPQARAVVPMITSGALDALATASIPMPDPEKDGTRGEIQPGGTWKLEREITIEFQDRLVLRPQPGQPQNPNATPPPQPPPRKYRFKEVWTFKYVGTRERGGVKEAVVEVSGTITQAPGSKNAASGAIKGVVLVELDTGVVLDADIERDFEVDTSERGMKKNAAGVYKYRIIRSAAN